MTRTSPATPHTIEHRPRQVADAAVTALIAEAELTPTPGLVDARGAGAHTDMNLAMLTSSARSLRDTFEQCAARAHEVPVGLELRAQLAAIGRAGEATMMSVTGGVNTHRGAIWALGLLCAGCSLGESIFEAVAVVGALASLPDIGGDPTWRTRSHGGRAGARYGTTGAAGQAAAGFPHVITHGLPTLYAARDRGVGEGLARLDALLAIMARLDDTCLLQRGGMSGLCLMQDGAQAALAAGGASTSAGARLLTALDTAATRRHLSTGGSGDLLAATLFLDARYPCKEH